MSKIPYELIDVEKNEDSRSPEKPTFFSMWHVLVSSNVKTEDSGIANDIGEDLKQSIVYAFRDHGEEVFVVKRPGDEFDSDTVERIKISFAAEVGEDPKGGRVHVHSLVEVEHHTILQVNPKAAQEKIREYLQKNDNIMGAYINIKWVPTSKPLERYLGKNPLTRGEGAKAFESDLLHKKSDRKPRKKD